MTTCQKISAIARQLRLFKTETVTYPQGNSNPRRLREREVS